MDEAVGASVALGDDGAEGSAAGVGAEPIDVFVDGAVRYGDWAAAAWWVGPDRWGAVGYREERCTAVEADAIAWGLSVVLGPVRLHSDCKPLVDAFPPDRAGAAEFSWRTQGRWRILAAMDAAWEAADGRDVEVVHVPGHGRSALPETRLVDMACRYAIVRLAAAGGSSCHVGPDDLPQLGLLIRGGSWSVDEAFVAAAGERLLDLRIFNPDDPAHDPPFADWASGALRCVVAPLSATPRPDGPAPFPWVGRTYQLGGS